MALNEIYRYIAKYHEEVSMPPVPTWPPNVNLLPQAWKLVLTKSWPVWATECHSRDSSSVVQLRLRLLLSWAVWARAAPTSRSGHRPKVCKCTFTVTVFFTEMVAAKFSLQFWESSYVSLDFLLHCVCKVPANACHSSCACAPFPWGFRNQTRL